uniref:Rhodanese domain-containing protein n=1 Tax=Ditylenchus dipsaci TaxID=166011 RepID=A0A915DT74_9BILA
MQSTNEAHEIGPELLADYLKKQKDELANRQPSKPVSAPLFAGPKESEKTDQQGKCLIVDCRSFIDYNNSHVKSAINAFYSKIMRRRLIDNKACTDFILNHLSHGLGDSVYSTMSTSYYTLG